MCFLLSLLLFIRHPPRYCQKQQHKRPSFPSIALSLHLLSLPTFNSLQYCSCPCCFRCWWSLPFLILLSFANDPLQLPLRTVAATPSQALSSVFERVPTLLFRHPRHFFLSSLLLSPLSLFPLCSLLSPAFSTSSVVTASPPLAELFTSLSLHFVTSHCPLLYPFLHPPFLFPNSQTPHCLGARSILFSLSLLFQFVGFSSTLLIVIQNRAHC